MRRRLEPALRRLWAGEGGTGSAAVSLGLLPLELVYRIGVELRNRAYDLGLLPTHRVDVPVVSVGNLLVGGSGKTPVAAWIAGFLADRGRLPAVILRGYGGDEAALHRAWNPEVRVIVTPDRVEGARRALRSGRNAVVLDDGFQHRRLERSLDIVLHPVERAWRSHLLPRGPLREPPASVGRAHQVILTRRTADERDSVRAEHEIREAFPHLPVARVRLVPAGWHDVSGAEREEPSGPLLAVTGIARPESFRKLAERATGEDVELLTFPDHHAFTPADLDEIARRAGERTVILTEKDAVRLRPGAVARTPGTPFLEEARVLRLRVEGEKGVDGLRSRLLDATSTEPVKGPASSEAGDGR